MKGSLARMAVAIAIMSTLSFTGMRSAGAAAVTEFETSGFFSGPLDFSVQKLPEFVPGAYRASLIDLQFPAPFDAIAMGISSDQGLLGIVALNDGMTSGSFAFDVLPDTEYFLGIIGFPGTFAPGPGLPEVQLGSFSASVSAVPIPAAIVMMGSALFGLVVVMRRRGDVDEDGVPA